MHIVIVGNGAAAVSAVEALRETDAASEVTVLTPEDGSAYTPCFLAKYVAGEVDFEKLAMRSDDFYERHRVKLRTGEVARVDVEGKAVVLGDGSRVPYDRLLLACGAAADVPRIPGLAGPGVAVFKSLADAAEIKDLAKKARHAVVLGSGFVAVEIAEALAKAGMAVTLVARKDRILRRIFDAELAAMVDERMSGNGVNIAKGREVSKIERSSKTQEIRGVVLSDGERVPCDLLVLAVGMKPNVGVVKGSCIEVGRGVVTDASMRTSVPDVFAAGDVAEVEIGGVRKTNLIHPNAVATGRVAGRAMVGAGGEMAQHLDDMNVLTVFGRAFVSVGALDGDRVLERRSPSGDVLKLFVGSDDLVKGVELAGDVTRAGMYASLIERKVPVSTMPDILTPGFNYGQTLGRT